MLCRAGERRDVFLTNLRDCFGDIQPALHVADSAQECPRTRLRGVRCRCHACGNCQPMQLAIDLGPICFEHIREQHGVGKTVWNIIPPAERMCNRVHIADI